MTGWKYAWTKIRLRYGSAHGKGAILSIWAPVYLMHDIQMGNYVLELVLGNLGIYLGAYLGKMMIDDQR